MFTFAKNCSMAYLTVIFFWRQKKKAASRLKKIPRLVDKMFRVLFLSLFDAKWANKGNAKNFKELFFLNKEKKTVALSYESRLRAAV